MGDNPLKKYIIFALSGISILLSIITTRTADQMADEIDQRFKPAVSEDYSNFVSNTPKLSWFNYFFCRGYVSSKFCSKKAEIPVTQFYAPSMEEEKNNSDEKRIIREKIQIDLLNNQKNVE